MPQLNSAGNKKTEPKGKCAVCGKAFSPVLYQDTHVYGVITVEIKAKDFLCAKHRGMTTPPRPVIVR